MRSEMENQYNCSGDFFILSGKIKSITIEQNMSDIFLRYGIYKEFIELLISMQPKRIEIKEGNYE